MENETLEKYVDNSWFKCPHCGTDRGGRPIKTHEMISDNSFDLICGSTDTLKMYTTIIRDYRCKNHKCKKYFSITFKPAQMIKSHIKNKEE